MEVLINNFLKYKQQAIKPILFLALVFFIVVAIRMCQEECRDRCFDETEVGKKYLVAHGLACVFAYIYSCILYFVPGNKSEIATFLMLVIFYGFMVTIIVTQNEENGGCIEDFEGASGVIMYVSSVLSPVVFVIIHLLLSVVCFFVYKRKDNDEVEVWKKRFFRRLIDCVEALVASIIVKVFTPNSFIENLWLNAIVIAVFALVIPLFNDWVYKHFSLC